MRLKLLLLIYIVINTVKNFTTIHLQLSLTNVLEVIILLMIYLIKYVFQTTEDLNLSVFNKVTRINESKALTKHVSYEPKCKFDETKCNSNHW